MAAQQIKSEVTPSVEELMYMYESDVDTWQPASDPSDLAFQMQYTNITNEFNSSSCPQLSFSTVASSSASLSSSPDPSTPGVEEDESSTFELNCKGFVNYNPNPTSSDLIQRAGTRKDRRRQQNRLAQKKYRARKERLITDLQGELDGLRRERDAAMQLNARLMMEIRTLRYTFMPGAADLSRVTTPQPQMGMMMYAEGP